MSFFANPSRLNAAWFVLLFIGSVLGEIEDNDGKCDFLFVECEAVCEFTCAKDPQLTDLINIASHPEIADSLPWSHLSSSHHQQVDRSHKSVLLGRLHEVYSSLKEGGHAIANGDGSQLPVRFQRHGELAKTDPQLLFWPCVDHCRYACMHDVAALRASQSRPVVKFDGKWPFQRVGICQEILSTMWSLANGLPYLILLMTVPSLRLPYKVYVVVVTLMWLSSAIFHCRDCWFTMCLDYFFAFGGILSNFAIGLDNVLVSRSVSRQKRFGAAVILVMIWVVHSMYMSLISFDFDWNMTLAVTFGLIGTILWVYWYCVNRIARPHAWLLLPGTLGLFPFLVLFELNDFPPGPLGLADAHSYWHLSTIPMSVMWAIFFAKETQWERRLRKD